MGRPLNSKYFNPVPTSNGEGVASVTITGQGNYNALATVTFSPPALPNGTTATGSVLMELRSVAINNAGGSYTAGDVLVIGGGTVVADTTAGTYTVQAQIVVDTVDAGTGAITAFTTLSVRGSYSALPQKVTGGSNTTNLSLDGGTGNNARVNVTWRVLSVTITDPGAGYISVSDAAPTFSAGTSTATGASVLTTTGTNVILAHAYVVDGTQTLDADIIKQTSTNEYLMETTEGQSIVTLVASSSLSEGQAYIEATDALGSTYYVTKLTAHLAVLEQWADGGSGFVHNGGTEATWTLESTSIDPTGETVQIESV
jgi:hypothetical protein